MPDKFGEKERRMVVSEIENYFGVTLLRRRPWRKLFEDSEGSIWLVIGGYGRWHGIKKGVVDSVRQGHLIVARRMADEFIVYKGALRPVLDSIQSLHSHDSGDYSFNIRWVSGYAEIEELPGYRLEIVFKMELEST